MIETSEKIVLCSGWMKYNGLEKLLPSLKKAISQNANIIIYSNSKHTEEKVIHKLNELQIKHILAPEDKVLHSKIYYFQSKDKFTALIGSANITLYGLTKSEELSLKISGDCNTDEYHQINAYFQRLDKKYQ